MEINVLLSAICFTVASVLLFVAMPDKHGVSPRFLRFDRANPLPAGRSRFPGDWGSELDRRVFRAIAFCRSADRRGWLFVDEEPAEEVQANGEGLDRLAAEPRSPPRIPRAQSPRTLAEVGRSRNPAGGPDGV